MVSRGLGTGYNLFYGCDKQHRQGGVESSWSSSEGTCLDGWLIDLPRGSFVIVCSSHVAWEWAVSLSRCD